MFLRSQYMYKHLVNYGLTQNGMDFAWFLFKGQMNIIRLCDILCQLKKNFCLTDFVCMAVVYCYSTLGVG